MMVEDIGGLQTGAMHIYTCLSSYAFSCEAGAEQAARAVGSARLIAAFLLDQSDQLYYNGEYE